MYIRSSCLYSFFLVLALGLTACSSENSGNLLPEVAVDKTAPKVMRSVPEVEDTVISSYTLFTHTFDELVDLDSLSDNVELFSLNARDINVNLDSLSGSLPIIKLDKRALDYRVDRAVEVVTITQAEDSVSDDGEIIVGGDTTVEFEERTVNVLQWSGAPSLALASEYGLYLRQGLKDRSPNETINPVSGLLDTGNFLEKDFLYRLRTVDGRWYPSAQANDDVFGGTLFAGKSRFEGLNEHSMLVWKQQYIDGNSLPKVGLYARNYDLSAEDLSGTSYRLDKLIGDTLGANVSSAPNVIDFDTSANDQQVCVVWSQDNAGDIDIGQNIYARCIEQGGVGPRALISNELLVSQLDTLKIQVIDDSFLVSYLLNDQVKLFVGDFNADGAPLVQAQDTIGSATSKIDSYIVLTNHGAKEGGEFMLVASYDETALAPNLYTLKRHVLTSQDAQMVIGTETIASDSSPLLALSGGIDAFDAGFVGWLSGSGSDRSFFTARYNSVFWETPIRAAKDGSGAVRNAKVVVFPEGQSLFVWEQNLGATSNIVAQGYFPNLEGQGFVRPAPFVVATGLQPFDVFGLVGDREGNANVFYRSGGRFASHRFLDNREWGLAWNDAVQHTDASLDDNTQLFVASETGRLVALYNKLNQAGTEVYLSLFSE